MYAPPDQSTRIHNHQLQLRGPPPANENYNFMTYVVSELDKIPKTIAMRIKGRIMNALVEEIGAYHEQHQDQKLQHPHRGTSFEVAYYGEDGDNAGMDDDGSVAEEDHKPNIRIHETY